MYLKRSALISVSIDIFVSVTDIGAYITQSITHFDFSEHTLFRVQCLITHLGGEEFIDPGCEKSDNAGGAFMMFAIRDALEFSGLLPNRKKHPAKELKLAHYKIEQLKEQNHKLEKALADVNEQ